MLWQTRLRPWSENTSPDNSAWQTKDDDLITNDDQEEEEEDFEDDGDEESDFDEDDSYFRLRPTRANQMRLTRSARCQSFVMGL